jgi:hypothetical protein
VRLERTSSHIREIKRSVMSDTTRAQKGNHDAQRVESNKFTSHRTNTNANRSCSPHAGSKAAPQRNATQHKPPQSRTTIKQGEVPHESGRFTHLCTGHPPLEQAPYQVTRRQDHRLSTLCCSPRRHAQEQRPPPLRQTICFRQQRTTTTARETRGLLFLWPRPPRPPATPWESTTTCCDVASHSWLLVICLPTRELTTQHGAFQTHQAALLPSWQQAHPPRGHGWSWPALRAVLPMQAHPRPPQTQLFPGQVFLSLIPASPQFHSLT